MPARKPNPNGEGEKAEQSAMLSVLQQYLSHMETPTKKKGGKKKKDKVMKIGRASHRKVYVKNMKVSLHPKKKTVKKETKKDLLDEVLTSGPVVPTPAPNAIPELERSLQEYISRRSAYLNRAAGETAPSLIPKGDLSKLLPPEVQKKEGDAEPPKLKSAASVEGPERAVGTLSAIPTQKEEGHGPVVVPVDERIPVATPTITVQLPTIERNETEIASGPDNLSSTIKQTPTAPSVAEEVPANGTGFNRLLKYLPFFSSTVLETAKRTDTLVTQVEEAKKEAHTMAERIRAAEARMASWGKSPELPPLPPAPVPGATIVPVTSTPNMPAGASILPVQTIVVNKTVVAPLQVAPTTVASGSTKELVSSFEKQPQKEGVLPGGGKTLSAPEKAVDRKKILENEEKKAEILMMSAAKKIVPKKAGFFAEFSASMQYMGMAKQRISMIQNLATMLNAGLPLVDALRTLQMETKNKSAKKLLRAIMVAVDNGSPLWRAMDDQHFFSPHAIALIRIGEEAGNLAQNMQYLAAQQEKDQALKEKVQMAMIYPTIVMVLMFGIVVGLGTFVLPSLIGVLQSLNADLPFATIMLIRFTDGFTTYGYIVIPGLIFSALALAFLAKFTRFKIVTQWITFRIPGIGKLAREATLARFGVILGGLLQAGVPLVEALRSLVEVTPTVAYKSFYRRLLDHVNGGDSFARSFTVIRGTNSILPVSIQQLIITGEKTGSLATIMLKISDIYEKEANNTAQKLPVILEPLILLFIGLLVGTIAFAIIIPIYSIVGKVGK